MISLGKQKNSTTGQRTTPARATEEHNQLDQPTRPIENQVKPLSKRPGDDGLPSERFDTKVCQQLESPHRTAVGNTEGSPYDELPNPNNLSETKKPSRDKSEISKSPGPTTAPVLEGWPLIFAYIATFIGGMFLPNLRFPDLRVPEFRAVDWNERAIELEMALATISRVILFGEASLSQQRLHPGMLPVDGLAHDHKPSFGPNERIPVRSKWFSNSTEFPQYEPWLTTSSGVFVPEPTFLEDLWVVTHGTCFDLGSIPIPDESSPSDDFCFLLARTLSGLDTFYLFNYYQFGSYYTEIPKPRDYAEAQMNNGTANFLVQHVLDVIVGRRLNEADEVEGPTYGNIIDHSIRLDKLCDLFPQLKDHVSKAIRSANRTELNAYQLSRLKRIQDVAPFLRDIATPRLEGMQAIAKRGVQLLKETEKRQAELQSEIERTLRNGWLGPRVEWLSRRIICYYLPDLKSMVAQWTHARQWLAVESEEVFEIYQGRQAEFRLLDTGPPSNLSKKQLFKWYLWKSEMIWSRWSLEDRRKYPEGKESFCWSETDWRPYASIWQRMVGWTTGRANVDIPSQCGDASKRHG
ncbi:hypothetical protein LRP88_03484 [Fusarium phalaenopsidis]